MHGCVLAFACYALIGAAIVAYDVTTCEDCRDNVAEAGVWWTLAYMALAWPVFTAQWLSERD